MRVMVAARHIVVMEVRTLVQVIHTAVLVVIPLLAVILTVIIQAQPIVGVVVAPTLVANAPVVDHVAPPTTIVLAVDQQIAVVIGTLENTNVTDNALRVERPKDQGGTHHVQ